jgi:hypothetical protein
MRKPKALSLRRGGGQSEAARDEDRIDPDAPELADVDWTRLRRHTVELDPALVEQMHARRRLKQLTLRVGLEQIAEARRVAGRTGAKYQSVLRRWLAEGASRARADRMRTKE